eukprot:jgi/Ulvmu1/3678/UM017_0093.1
MLRLLASACPEPGAMGRHAGERAREGEGDAWYQHDRSRLGTEGELRLVSREDINGYATGAVQVFLGGQWGAVCSARFDDRDAAVACRQLGFLSGTAANRPGDFFFVPLVQGRRPEVAEVVEVPFLLENLGCSGSEERLVDCGPQANGGAPPGAGCTPFEDNYAFAICGMTTGP